MASSKKTQNVVGSRRHKWNIKFSVPQCYIRNTQTKRHFVALKNMVIYVTRLTLKYILKTFYCLLPFDIPSSDISLYRPLFPVLFTLCHPLLLASTLISCHPPSFSCPYFFSGTSSSLHRVFMHYSHNPRSFSALKSR